MATTKGTSKGKADKKEATKAKAATAESKSTAKSKAAAAKPKAAARKPRAAAGAKALGAEERRLLIQRAAYLKAEANGFAGNPERYWLEAEAEAEVPGASAQRQ